MFGEVTCAFSLQANHGRYDMVLSGCVDGGTHIRSYKTMLQVRLHVHSAVHCNSYCACYKLDKVTFELS